MSVELPQATHNQQRIPALDGVRGLAILLVMLIHFADHTVAGESLANRIFVQIADSGWIGVDLFFVLSGFLITSLLLDAKGAPNYFRSFWARRALRIFPAYYACLFVWFVVAPLLAPHFPHGAAGIAKLHTDQAWYWSYLSNWKMGMDGEWAPLGTSLYWSLAVEEQFYLAWPVVVFLCSPRTLARLSVALIAIALVLRIYLVAKGSHPIFVYTSTPTRMDTLATGALVAVLARDREAWTHVQRSVRWILPLTISGLGLVWMWIGSFSLYDARVQTVGFTALSLLFGSLIVQVASSPSRSLISLAFSNGTLRFFGKYSYAMYLFHETIAVLVVPRLGFDELHGGWGQVARLAVLTPVTVAAALLSWHLLEKHFIALKRFFPATSAAVAPSLRLQPDRLTSERPR